MLIVDISILHRTKSSISISIKHPKQMGDQQFQFPAIEFRFALASSKIGQYVSHV